MPSVQQNHGLSFVQNARSGRLSTFTLFGTPLRCGVCEVERSPRAFGLVRMEELKKENNVVVVHIAECYLMVIDLADSKEYILEAIMGNIEF